MRSEAVYILFQGMQVVDVFETLEKAEIRANVLMEYGDYTPRQAWTIATKVWVSPGESTITIVKYEVH